MEADETVNYPTEFILSTINATARTAIEKRCTNYHVVKYQLAKALQRHVAFSKKKLMNNVVEAIILTRPLKDLFFETLQ